MQYIKHFLCSVYKIVIYVTKPTNGILPIEPRKLIKKPLLCSRRLKKTTKRWISVVERMFVYAGHHYTNSVFLISTNLIINTKSITIFCSIYKIDPALILFAILTFRFFFFFVKYMSLAWLLPKFLKEFYFLPHTFKLATSLLKIRKD